MFLRARKPKQDPNRIAKICYGHLREDNLSFNNNYIIQELCISIINISNKSYQCRNSDYWAESICYIWTIIFNYYSFPLRRGVLDTTLWEKVCQLFATGRWFFAGTLVSSTNKTDRHDMAEILLKVALNTITVTIITTASSHVNGFSTSSYIDVPQATHPLQV